MDRTMDDNEVELKDEIKDNVEITTTPRDDDKLESKDDTQQNTSLENSSHQPTEREMAAMMPRNHYGFLVSSNSTTQKPPLTKSQSKMLQETERNRVKKWLKLIKNWNFNLLTKYDKISRRARKGVPDELRGKVWTLFCHNDDLKKKHINLTNMNMISTLSERVLDEIDRDIDRTFPRHELFVIPGGPGQIALQKVLRLYAAHDPEVGYCQGMGFITATFLTYMPEDAALYCLYFVLQRPSFPLRKLYLPNMAMTQTVLYVFSQLGALLVPTVWHHLESQGVHHSMYATSWFMTLFASSFPFELVTRIFDIFLLEGQKIIYRVSLALLKWNEAKILSSDFEGVMKHVKDIPSSVENKIDEFFEVVWSIPLKTSQIMEFEEQYKAELRLHASKTPRY